MKTDRTTQAASLFLIMLFLGNNLMASAHALVKYEDYALKAGVQTLPAGPLGPLSETAIPPATVPVKRVAPEKPASPKEATKKYQQVEYLSMKGEGYLGQHPKNPERLPSDHIFTIKVEQDAGDYSHAYLEYSIEGLKDGSSIPKAINNKATYAGQAIEKGTGWQNIKFEIDPTDLKAGENQVRFALAQNQSMPVTIKNVGLVFSNKALVAATMGKVKREIPDKKDFEAYAPEVSLSKYVVKDIDMPTVPNNIVNVDKNNWGYLVQSDQAQDIRVSIAVDPERLPAGNSLSNVQIFYFDSQSLSWKTARVDSINMASSKVGGQVPGNTNYFAGMIKVPDMPEASANLPTAISDIKAANPAAGMNIMQPPSVSPTGDAGIQYPLDIPKGRQGMTPDVTLTYSSDAGTGWLGVGWNITVPSVSIDTKWGVPTFPSGTQDEVYMLNGKDLIQQGGTKGNRAQVSGSTVTYAPRLSGTVNFFEPTMSSYKEIKRFGSATNAYYWTETTADQTIYYYGTTNGTSLDTNFVLKDANNNIVKWYLAKVKDKWGNTINYTYTKHKVTGNANPLKNGAFTMVLSKIQYTGYGSDPGKYALDFVTSGGRTDATLSLKTGMKILDDKQLNSIQVSYNGSQIKEFKFKYSNSDASLFKTLLDSVSEYRSGDFFYQHKFEYYQHNISYSATPQTLNMSGLHSDKLDNIPDEVATVASAVGNRVFHSPIKTTITAGWGAGGSIGLGLAPGLLPFPDKPFTFSGRLGYSENHSWDKVSLDDFNGDGIPDIVYNSQSGAQYYPLTLDNSTGDLSLGNYHKIHYAGRMMKSSSNSTDYGLDFVLPENAFYFGMNWNKTQSNTSTYLTDYNADGIKDIVQPNGSSESVVLFGTLKSNGDLDFSSSSENTVNPILKGQQLTATVAQDPPMDFEIVRTWEAPFDGTVDITGTASMASTATGTISVGVQLNGSFLGSLQTVSPSNSQSVSHSGVSVVKGDKLLFRVRSGSDGQEDLLEWNPRVAYRSPNQNRTDANGINYSTSTYEDGFLLSAPEGVTFSGDEQIKVDWSSFTINNLTDDVVLKINLKVIDTTTGNLAYDYSYVDPIAAGNSQTPTGSNFSEINNATAPSFISTFAKALSSIDGNYNAQLSFEIWSTSNVVWKDIDWRPEVRLGNPSCGQQPRISYPTVFYSTYNRVQKLDAPYTVSGSIGSGTYLRAWPNLSYSSGNFSEIFTTDELNSSSDINYVAYLVCKSGGNLLSKMAIVFSNHGSISYKAVSTTGVLGSGLGLTQSSSVYSFRKSSVTGNTLFVGLFTNREGVSEFLKNHLNYIGLYQAGTTTLLGSITKYNSFYQDLNELQDYYRDWGQFVWSKSDTSAIDTADMHMSSKAVALDPDNDYRPGHEPPTATDISGLSSQLDPSNQNFFMTIPKRGELSSDIRDYIKDYAYGYTPGKLDRWTAWGTFMAAYSNDGATAPGKLGEEEETTITSPVTPDLYSAYGTEQKSLSFSLSTSENIGGIFGESASIIAPSTYFSHQLSSSMDVNGDGYPDILTSFGSLLANVTGPTGGYTGDISLTSNEMISKSTTDNGGASVQGTFSNQDVRFIKQKLPVSGSVGFGNNDGHIEWLDINGDGLPDRTSDETYSVGVSLNDGKGLLTAVPVSAGLSSSSNFNSSLSVGIPGLDNLTSKLGFSFSAGVGINTVGSKSEELFLDLNGDGLPDLITQSGSSVSVLLNTGTDFQTYNPTGIDLSDVTNLNKSSAVGLSGSAAGTMSFPIFSVFTFNLKVSLSGNGQVNYSINKLKSSFKDMNGDGVVDYIEDDGSGNLVIYYSQLGDANLLKTVTNPLKGSFTITYEKVGNKYGLYPTQVKIDNTHAGEKMDWDMPNSKYVMSSLTVDDGLNFVDGGVDLDGEDEVQYTFKYDGGIKSRRERDFLGFTRTETDYPANIPQALQGQTDKIYMSEVTEYARPLKNDPQYRKRFEYMKGIPMDKYTLENIVHKISETEDTYTIKLMKHEEYEYEYRNVVINSGQSYFNQVQPSSQINWNQVSESQCIFPALVTHKVIDLPQTADPTKFQQHEYAIQYDSYFNVTQYMDKGVMTGGALDSVVTDTIFDSHFDYVTENYSAVSLLNGNSPFTTISYNSATGERICSVASSVPGYSTDTICSSAYIDLDPCDGGPAGEDSVAITHRKLVVDTILIWKEDNNVGYSGTIIAQMTYYDPGHAGNQTNMLETHKIYLGSTASANLRRYTEVGSLNTGGKAPAEILNYLDATNKAITNITYDTKGNVTQIQGPANQSNQRLSTNFTYDSQVYQFVIGITNSYNDEICNMYDYATGNLLKTVDVNGYATQYVYDNVFRLKEVWAPRELENTSAPATISFSYYPRGIDPSNSNYLVRVPVAISKHAINNNLGTLTVTPPTTISCTSLVSVSGRPAMTNPLNTATFIDGMQRVIQVKKEVSVKNTGGTANIKTRLVSGITVYDRRGLETSVSLSRDENASYTLGELDNTKASYNSEEKQYDYANRVVESLTFNESYDTVGTFITYDWDNSISSQDHFYTQTVSEGQTARTYVDSWQHPVAKVQELGSNDATTLFTYNALNELTQTTDPVGEVTSYTYDHFGRMTQEVHPDRGTTNYTYDMAGNLTKLVNPATGSTGIIMSYNFKRLTAKTYPNTGVVNDVTYTYGSLGDGVNGAGRVVEVVQGDNFKTEDYTYDELGNVVADDIVALLPQIGQQTYHTKYSYDSWGRITSLTYPDGDELAYTYSSQGGELESMVATKTSGSQDIVSKALYDGYGNMAVLDYGNGTSTTFTYNTYTRRLTDLNLTAPGSSTYLDKDYTYDKRGNVSSMENVASVTSNGLGGAYTMDYTYDGLNRLSTASGTFHSNEHNYDLDMDYNLAGGIVHKTQTDVNASSVAYPNVNYGLSYGYTSTKKHRLQQIGGLKGKLYYFDYNSSGSVTGSYYIDHGVNIYDQSLWWDEEQKLHSVANENGIHYYVYNQDGERFLKTSLRITGADNNHNGGHVQSIDPLTIYVNPYYVVKNYNSVTEASKHYYMGSQRVATALITYPFQDEGEDPLDQSHGVTKDFLEVLDHYGLTAGDNYDEEEVLSAPTINLFESETDYQNQADGCEDEFCKCSQSEYWAGQADGIDCSELRIMYWYHPDYLGNTEFITDFNGDAYQYFWYSPWGESLVDQYSTSGTYNSPYRFNGKELDPETGNYYYGARYYNPQTSIWLSVDPLAHKYPSMSPYVFSGDNPIIMLDPNGEGIWDVVKGVAKGIGGWVADAASSIYNLGTRGREVTTNMAMGGYMLLNEVEVHGAKSTAQKAASGVSNYVQTKLDAIHNDQTGEETAKIITRAVVDVGTIVGTDGLGELGKAADAVKAADALADGGKLSEAAGALKPLGLGSTGRATATNLTEQLSMEEIMSNPTLGSTKMTGMGDSRWSGWNKMQYTHTALDGTKTTIHYVGKVENGFLKAVDDFKFVK